MAKRSMRKDLEVGNSTCGQENDIISIGGG